MEMNPSQPKPTENTVSPVELAIVKEIDEKLNLLLLRDPHHQELVEVKKQLAQAQTRLKSSKETSEGLLKTLYERAEACERSETANRMLRDELAQVKAELAASRNDCGPHHQELQHLKDHLTEAHTAIATLKEHTRKLEDMIDHKNGRINENLDVISDLEEQLEDTKDKLEMATPYKKSTYNLVKKAVKDGDEYERAKHDIAILETRLGDQLREIEQLEREKVAQLKRSREWELEIRRANSLKVDELLIKNEDLLKSLNKAKTDLGRVRADFANARNKLLGKDQMIRELEKRIFHMNVEGTIARGPAREAYPSRDADFLRSRRSGEKEGRYHNARRSPSPYTRNVGTSYNAVPYAYDSDYMDKNKGPIYEYDVNRDHPLLQKRPDVPKRSKFGSGPRPFGSDTRSNVYKVFTQADSKPNPPKKEFGRQVPKPVKANKPLAARGGFPPCSGFYRNGGFPPSTRQFGEARVPSKPASDNAAQIGSGPSENYSEPRGFAAHPSKEEKEQEKQEDSESDDGW